MRAVLLLLWLTGCCRWCFCFCFCWCCCYWMSGDGGVSKTGRLGAAANLICKQWAASVGRGEQERCEDDDRILLRCPQVKLIYFAWRGRNVAYHFRSACELNSVGKVVFSRQSPFAHTLSVWIYLGLCTCVASTHSAPHWLRAPSALVHAFFRLAGIMLLFDVFKPRQQVLRLPF